MNRTPVSSSNLRSVGFDTGSSILEIEFHSGEVYVYFGVPESVYNELMAASSKGTFHDDRIKDRYPSRRL